MNRKSGMHAMRVTFRPVVAAVLLGWFGLWASTGPERAQVRAEPSPRNQHAGAQFEGEHKDGAQQEIRVGQQRKIPGPEAVTAPVLDVHVQLCEACSPVLMGVDCQSSGGPCTEPTWRDARPIPWQVFMQGEYIGPHRLPHVPEYRLRVNDTLEFVFRKTMEPSAEPYRLNVGDQIRIQSYIDANLDTSVTIQPDGMITLRLLHQIRAAGRTIHELEATLEEQYRQYYKQPSITVTPLQLESKLNELRASVDSRFGSGGQGRRATVTPDGMIQLPGLGSIPAQGLTTDELKREIEERYRSIVYGMEVTPVLVQVAPRFVYVLGEVQVPGRYEMTGPTTVMQAISLAGGWNIGGNLRQIVIFRRTDDWRLIATKVDVRGALYGKSPCPSDDLWIRDSDIVVLPKHPIQVANDWSALIFSHGIYRLLPNQGLTFPVSSL